MHVQYEKIFFAFGAPQRNAVLQGYFSSHIFVGTITECSPNVLGVAHTQMWGGERKLS